MELQMWPLWLILVQALLIQLSAAMKIIITASGIDNKFLNRLAVEICDYEYSDYEDRHDSIIQLSRDDKEGYINLSPPMREYDETKNEFLNWTIEQVEEYVSKKMEQDADWTDPFLLLDDRAKREGHCVVVERALSDDKDDDGKYIYTHFQKARTPRNQVWGMMANLEIANMGFDEYVSNEEGDPVLDEESGRHWYKYTIDLDESQESVLKRNASMERLTEQGLI